MKRAQILEEAKRCVCGDREQDYGKPENNFLRIATLLTAYIDAKYGILVPFDTEDPAHMMGLLKMARTMDGQYKADNYVDMAGYAACAGEIREELERQKQSGWPWEDDETSKRINRAVEDASDEY